VDSALQLEPKRAGGQDPDDQRMGDRRGKPEQHGLKNRPANRDDESRHHRFRMPRFEAVKRAEEDGGGHEDQGIAGALLKHLGNIHRCSIPPPPISASLLVSSFMAR
jgi:hypothetical protein